MFRESGNDKLNWMFRNITKPGKHYLFNYYDKSKANYTLRQIDSSKKHIFNKQI